MGRIRGIITDFDGTLVDTFLANFFSYHAACEHYGYTLTKEQYSKWYGLRYDDLCNKIGIKSNDDKKGIKELKKKIYPSNFEYLKLNSNLLKFIINAKENGIKTCIASTASADNLYNVLYYFNIENYFDIIITGENVKKGKPDPEVYNKAMDMLDCSPDEVLVFEDSETGCEAVENAELNYIKIIEFKHE